MGTDAVETFFALLAVLALAFVAVSAGLAAVRGATGRLPRWAIDARTALVPAALPFAWAVATTATLGSLYLSEVANYPPCLLCWYQRIAMYPLAVILGVAALRRDTNVRFYVVPVAAIGLGISIYHYLLERFPDSVTTACTDDVPCETVWVWKFSFLSIPAMAGIGFAAIITLVLIAATGRSGTGSGRRDDSSPATDRTDPSDRADLTDLTELSEESTT